MSATTVQSLPSAAEVTQLILDPDIRSRVEHGTHAIVKLYGFPSHSSFCKHITNVLYMAVFSDDQQIALFARLMLHSRRPEIVRAAAQSNFFEVHAPTILVAQGPYIGIFASLTDVCFSSFPSELASSFPLFNRFLRLTSNYLVLTMLESLLAYTDEKIPLYSQLKEMRFVAKIASRLKKCQDDTNRPSLLRLLVRCFENPELRSVCSDPSITPVIVNFSPDSPSDILTWHWQLLNECGSLDVLDHPHFLSYALAVITGAAASPVLESFQVSAIDFFAVVLDVRPAAVCSISVGDLADALKLLCERFPNHGIALRAIGHLIVTAVRTPETSDVFLDSFVPVFADWIRMEADNRLTRAIAIDCARKIMHRADVEPDLAEKVARRTLFAQTCEAVVRWYEEVLEKAYQT
jgi:hypothetical protein